MKILKWVAISLLSLILFISLFAFGLAYSTKATALNPEFLPNEINNLPVSNLGSQLTSTNFPNLRPEVKAAIEQTVKDMEPQMKQATGAAVAQIYDYLLGKKPNPELATTLRNTVLSNAFVDSLIDKTPIATIASNTILEQLSKKNIPAELQPLLNYIQPAFEQAEPDIKTQIKNAAPPVIDYLLGKTKNFKVTISLQPIVVNLLQSAKDFYLKNPPPQLANIPASELAPYVDKYINQNIGLILVDVPSTVTFDETQLIGSKETPAQIANNIKQVEDQLSLVRANIKQFQQYYIYLIIIIVVLIAGIVALYRSVRRTTLNLGIIFVLVGVIQLAGVLIGKVILRLRVIPSMDLSAELKTFTQQFAYDMLSPLQIFSLIALGIGIVLLVLFFLYRPHTTGDKIELKPAT